MDGIHEKNKIALDNLICEHKRNVGEIVLTSFLGFYCTYLASKLRSNHLAVRSCL
jgi:hypothetical protein